MYTYIQIFIYTYIQIHGKIFGRMQVVKLGNDFRVCFT